MKKQSASTIKLFSIDDINKKDAVEKIKAALIGLGLSIWQRMKTKKHPLKRGGASSPFDSWYFLY